MTGAELITAERERQVEEEGWTTEHDSEHYQGELLMVASCYIMRPYEKPAGWLPRCWPRNWHHHWWKPKDHIRDLVRAGALIAAEIDRLQRATHVV